MPNIIDMTGRRYGKLTVICKDKNIGRIYYWKCKCECGNETSVDGSSLRSGHTKSCGCLKVSASKKHGMSRSRTYGIWRGMIDRCNNTNRNNYERYGGKGIAVCDEWMKFENFLSDMGEAPKKYTLDRIDNLGNYEPNNCRWATYKEQGSNSSINRIIEHNGESKTLAQWVDMSDIMYSTVLRRINTGMNIIEAIKTPVKKYTKLNNEVIKVIKYFHGKGYTQVRLAKIHNVSRQFISKALKA